MPLIEWTADFNTGIPAIDEQHRGLVDLVNAFDEASHQGRGSRVMNRLLNDLIGYTQEHFNYEEDVMAKAGYDKLDQHKALHRQLVQKIERFQYEFIHGGWRITHDVREFLKYWLSTHILKDDLEFASHAGESESVPEDTAEETDDPVDEPAADMAAEAEAEASAETVES